MVFQWFFYMWTIGINGFSMVFLHVNHWRQWFFNGFSDLNHLYQWFFQWFFTIEPLPLNEWFVAHHLHRWFINGFGESERWFTKKGQNAKKTWFVQQKHRNKQTLDTLTWPNVTKVTLGNHFSSILAFWLPPLQHLQVFILTMNGWKTTIDINGFTMVFGLKNHWYQWVFNGFWSKNHWYQWFFQWFLF